MKFCLILCGTRENPKGEMMEFVANSFEDLGKQIDELEKEVRLYSLITLLEKDIAI